MMQKFLKMNALLLDMLKTRDELNGDWKPQWDSSATIYEVFVTGEGNIAINKASYNSFHPFFFKDRELCKKFIQWHEGDLEEYGMLLWRMK